MNENEIITTESEDEDFLLPDGWADGDDIFDEATWTGTQTSTDEPSDATEQEAETDAAVPEEAPTPELVDDTGDTTEAPVEAPTPEPEAETPRAHKLKFTARVDRQDLDVELDESELPNVYQKAQATDRYQAKLSQLTPQLEKAERLAKTMGFDNLDAMLASAEENYQKTEVSRLVGEGVHEEVAKDMVTRRMQDRVNAPAAESAATPAAQPPARDFQSEINELRAVRPDLDRSKPLPQEVINACVQGGKRLIVAYTEYEVQQAKAEAERLAKKVKVLEQNEAAAARSPVSGVTGGGPTDTKPQSDFIRGFNEDY